MATHTATGVEEFAALVPPGLPVNEVARENAEGGARHMRGSAECAICLLPIIEPAAFPAVGCPHVYCVTCVASLQAHTPTKPIRCPQCRRQAARPLPPKQLPPPPVSRARRAAIMFCMCVGILLCLVALAYDMGVFGVPFYGSVMVSPSGEPASQNNETLAQARFG